MSIQILKAVDIITNLPLMNTAVKRNAHVRDLRKRGKNKGKLYTKECGLNKNTKNKKTPENIR